jgi:hypothetical protein
VRNDDDEERDAGDKRYPVAHLAGDEVISRRPSNPSVSPVIGLPAGLV